MYNIIKSLNYNARRDTPVIIALLSMIVLPVFALFIEGGSIEEMTADVFFIGQLGENFVITMFVIMVVACRICGADASDKTINYEFLSGHDRGSIYWARIIAGINWSVVIVMFLSYVPLLVLSIVNGWGQSLEPGNSVARLLLALLPAARLSAFLMMITMLVRSAGKGIALGYGSIMVMVILTSILQDVLHIDLTWQTAFSNVMSLLTFTNSRNIVIDGETVAVFDSALSVEMIVGTIVASFAATFIYTYIAYAVFKKKDRD